MENMNVYFGRFFIYFFSYMNYLYHVCDKVMNKLLFHNTNMLSKGYATSELQNDINGELQRIFVWLKVDTLSFDLNETHCLVLTRSKRYLCEIGNWKHSYRRSSTFEISWELLSIGSLTVKKYISNISGKISRGNGRQARNPLNVSALLT